MPNLGSIFAALVATALGGLAGCNDTPGPPSGPGNVLVNDTNEPDATVPTTVDAGADATPDVALDSAYMMEAASGIGGGDVVTPVVACASCKCSEKTGFCLENAASSTVSGSSAGGTCPMASGKLEIGCNALPADCVATPSCFCILNAIQPPLPCYPECTTASGYFDVFCANP